MQKGHTKPLAYTQVPSSFTLCWAADLAQGVTAAALRCLAAAPRLPDVDLYSFCSASTAASPTPEGPHGSTSTLSAASAQLPPAAGLPAACMALAAAHVGQGSLGLQPFVERACSAEGFARLLPEAQAALLQVLQTLGCSQKLRQPCLRYCRRWNPLSLDHWGQPCNVCLWHAGSLAVGQHGRVCRRRGLESVEPCCIPAERFSN